MTLTRLAATASATSWTRSRTTRSISFRVRLHGDLHPDQPRTTRSTDGYNIQAHRQRQAAGPAPAAATPAARSFWPANSDPIVARHVVRQCQRRLPRHRLLLPDRPPAGPRLDPDCGPPRRSTEVRPRRPPATPCDAPASAGGVVTPADAARSAFPRRAGAVPGAPRCDRPRRLSLGRTSAYPRTTVAVVAGRGTAPRAAPVRRCRALRPGRAGPMGSARPPCGRRGGSERAPRCGRHAGRHAQGRPMNRRGCSPPSRALRCCLSSVIPAPVVAADPTAGPSCPQSVKDLKLRQAGPRDRRRPADRPRAPRCAARRGQQDVVIRLKQKPRPPSKGAAGQKAQPDKVKAQQAAFVGRANEGRQALQDVGRTQVALNAVVARVDAKQLAAGAATPRSCPSARCVDYQLDLSRPSPTSAATAVQALGVTGDGHHRRRARLGHRLHPRGARRPGHGPGLQERLRHEAQGHQEREDQRRLQGQEAVPDRQGHRRLGLRRRGLGRRRGQPAAASRIPTPSRAARAPSRTRCDGSPRHPRRRHHRGQEGRRPRRQAARGQGLLADQHRRAPASRSSRAWTSRSIPTATAPPPTPPTSSTCRSARRTAPPRTTTSSAAVETATAAGTLVVASAGNSSDKPYVVGSPASAAVGPLRRPDGGPVVDGLRDADHRRRRPSPALYEAVFQSWSEPLSGGRSADAVQYGDGAGGNLDGCAAVRGRHADRQDRPRRPRGLQLQRQDRQHRRPAAARSAIIGLITPGDPFDGSLGVLRRTTCASHPAATWSASPRRPRSRRPAPPADVRPGQRRSRSSGTWSARRRVAPSNLLNLIKPEIGAPGASVSAVAGTGDRHGTLRRHVRRGPDGRRLGGAPRASAFPTRTPARDQGRAHQHGRDRDHEPARRSSAATSPRSPASAAARSGSTGRYRSPIAAWVDADQTAALGFGFHRRHRRRRRLHQDGRTSATTRHGPHLRRLDDVPVRQRRRQRRGRPSPHRRRVTVPAHGDATFDVTIAHRPGEAPRLGARQRHQRRQRRPPDRARVRRLRLARRPVDRRRRRRPGAPALAGPAAPAADVTASASHVAPNSTSPRPTPASGAASSSTR